jgi:hypothetical protein
MAEWISVQDRMPSERDFPIVVCNWDRNWYYVDAGFINKFSGEYTHWMPLIPPIINQEKYYPHTELPWEAMPSVMGNEDEYNITHEDYTIAIVCDGVHGRRNAKENAERIVACVSAFGNMSIEEINEIVKAGGVK